MAQLSTFANTEGNVVTDTTTKTITISNEVVVIDGTLDPPTGATDGWGGWRIICTSSGGFRSGTGANGTLGGGKQSLTIIEETGGYRFGTDNFKVNTARFSGDGTNVLKYHNINWIVQAGERSDFDIYRGTNANGSLGCRVEFSGVYLHQQAVSTTPTNFNHYSGRAEIKVHPQVGWGLRIRNETNGHVLEMSTPVHSGVEISGLVIDNVTGLTDGSSGSVNRAPTGARVAISVESAASNSTTTLSRLDTPSVTDVNGNSTKKIVLIDPVGIPTLTTNWNRNSPFEIRRNVPFTFTGASVPSGTTMHALEQDGSGEDTTATMSGESGQIEVRTQFASATSTTWDDQNTYQFKMTSLGLRKYALTTTQTIANSPLTITANLTADTLPNGSAISTITAPTDECDTLGEVLRVVKDWEVLNPTLSTAPDSSIIYVDGTSVKFNDGYSVVLNSSATELVGIASNVVTIKCSNSSDLSASNGLNTLAATGSSKTITTPSVAGQNISPADIQGGLTLFTATDYATFVTGTGFLLTNTGGYTGLTVNTTYYARQFGQNYVSWHPTSADAISGNGLISITGNGTAADMVWQTASSDPVEAADDVFLLDSTGQKSVLAITNNLGADARFTVIDTSDGSTVASNASITNGSEENIIIQTKGLTTGYRLVGKRPGYRYFSVGVDLTGGGKRDFTAPEQEEILLADGTGSYLRLIQTDAALEVTDSSTGTTPGMRLNIKNSTTTVRVLFKAIEDFLAGANGAKFMGLGGQQITYNQDTLNGDQIYLGANCKVKRRQTTDVNAAVRCSLFAGDGQPIDATNGDVQTIEGINVPALGTALLVNQDFDADDAGTQSIWGQLVAIKTAVDSGGGGSGGFTATDRTNLGAIKSTTDSLDVPTASENATAVSNALTIPTASENATAVSNALTIPTASQNATAVSNALTIPSVSQISSEIWGTIVDGGLTDDLEVVPEARAGTGFQISAADAALIANGDAFTFTATGGFGGINQTNTYYAWIGTGANNTKILYIYATRQNALTPGASFISVSDNPGSVVGDVRIIFPEKRPIGSAQTVLHRLLAGLVELDANHDAHSATTRDIYATLTNLLNADWVDNGLSLRQSIQLLTAVICGELQISNDGGRYLFHGLDTGRTARLRADVSDTGRANITRDPV